jgi:hypothetical protein
MSGVLLGIDLPTLTFDAVVNALLVLLALWGAYKVIVEIVAAINKSHDRAQKWDNMEQELFKNIQAERDKIYANYDPKLAGIEDRILNVDNKVDDLKCDQDAKMQEMKSELYILTECMAAVLAGLHEQGCNGRVTQAQSMLDEYLRKRAHE